GQDRERVGRPTGGQGDAVLERVVLESDAEAAVVRRDFQAIADLVNGVVGGGVAGAVVDEQGAGAGGIRGYLEPGQQGGSGRGWRAENDGVAVAARDHDRRGGGGGQELDGRLGGIAIKRAGRAPIAGADAGVA